LVTIEIYQIREYIMIVIFQSRAAGDVIMFGDIAYRLMEVIGKEPGPQGIVSVEQLPDAIARLRAALTADKSRHAELTASDTPKFEKAPDGSERPLISLTQRAVPLMELLELSLKKQTPVVWGV